MENWLEVEKFLLDVFERDRYEPERAQQLSFAVRWTLENALELIEFGKGRQWNEQALTDQDLDDLIVLVHSLLQNHESIADANEILMVHESNGPPFGRM